MNSTRALHPEVAIKELEAAIDALNECDFTMLTDDQLTSAVRDVHRLTSSLEAASARLVAVTDSRHAVEDEGAQSIGRWVAWRCHIPVARAKREARIGRALRHMPEVETAFVRGEITSEHVRMMAEAADLNRIAFERDVEMLLNHARRLSYGQFTKSMAHWSYVNAPDDVEKKAKERDAGRKVHCSQTWGGAWALNGLLPAVGGTIFANELERLEKKMFEADVADARERLGRAPLPGELSRTAQQRRCDALIEMARRSSARGRGKPARPLFTVLVGYDGFKQTCELSNGTVVTPGQLVPYLAEAEVERIVFDGPSRVLDVGVRQRVFTGATRRAVEVRDRTCWHPSCEVPAESCEVDHTQPYEMGGLTVQSNGGCGCKFHHRLKHKRPRPPTE